LSAPILCRGTVPAQQFGRDFEDRGGNDWI
jgi:hypothetical protein